MNVSSNLPEHLIFHHCIPTENVRYRTFRPNRNYSDRYFRPAYEWLEEVIGYYPFFFSVGSDEAAIRMTGYDDNWRVLTGTRIINGKRKNSYRKAGEFPNIALFSFDHMDGIFMDYGSWHIALNACMNGRHVTEAERKMIFKPSWSRNRWIRAALTGTHPVQLAAAVLPLKEAKRTYVRNLKTGKRLRLMGFPDPEVKRIPVISIILDN
ncbi:MAG: hypothetical protein WC626_09045 [Methanoregula sp.]